MYVSGIRVSSFLTIMYLWHGKKNTRITGRRKNKQYKQHNVVVLNVQSLFEKEETNRNKKKVVLQLQLNGTNFPTKWLCWNRTRTDHTQTLVENQFLDASGSVGTGRWPCFKKTETKNNKNANESNHTHTFTSKKASKT